MIGNVFSAHGQCREALSGHSYEAQAHLRIPETLSTVLTEDRLVFSFGSKVLRSSINMLGMIPKIILGDNMTFAYLSLQVFLDYKL